MSSADWSCSMEDVHHWSQSDGVGIKMIDSFGPAQWRRFFEGPLLLVMFGEMGAEGKLPLVTQECFVYNGLSPIGPIDPPLDCINN